MVIEQFGEKYLTLYNHGKAAADVKLKFKIPVASVRELVGGTSVAIDKGRSSLTLGADDVTLLELQFSL